MAGKREMSTDKMALCIVVLLSTVMLVAVLLNAVYSVIEQGGINKDIRESLLFVGGIEAFVGMVIRYWTKLT